MLAFFFEALEVHGIILEVDTTTLGCHVEFAIDVTRYKSGL